MHGLASIPESVDQEALAEAWLHDLERQVAAGQRAAGTLASYRKAIRPWLRYLRGSAGSAPAPDTVQAYLESSAPLAPATRNLRLRAVRALYRWAESRSRYPSIARSVTGVRERRDGPLAIIERGDLVRAAKALDEERPRRRRLAAWEEDLHEIQHLRDGALFRVVAGTGLRLVSLQRGRVDQVVDDGGVMTLTYQGKGSQAASELAIIPPQAAEAVRRYLRRRQELGLTSPALWIRLRGAVGGPLNIASLRRIICRALDGAGLRPRESSGALIHGRVYGPHCLRRTAVTQVARSFGLEAARAFADHASLEVTRRSYVRVDRYRTLLGAAKDLDILDPMDPEVAHG